jgi:precorrin-3B synthase
MAAARAYGRRGACPGLSTPMPTGDGLLARLTTTRTFDVDRLIGLCGAVRRHGNGIIEITARGNFQIRGLDLASHAKFASAMAQLRIGGVDGVSVIADPLAGLALDAEVDSEFLAGELRRALSPRRFSHRSAPKLSVAIDGGGALHLDGLTADVHLRAAVRHEGPWMHIGIAGDATTAHPLGAVEPIHMVETTVRLLEVVANHGPDARARDVIITKGLAPFRAAAANRLVDAPLLPLRPSAEPIGMHDMCGHELAIGIGFAFGHCDALALQKLAELPCVARAGFRPAPGRALLILGIPPRQIKRFTTAAKRLGFVVAPDDARRRVVACAGAPICTSGEIPARALAPNIAHDIAPLLAGDEVLHLSGCAKGCAHHGTAALTAIGHNGGCDLLVDGMPAGSCAVPALPQRLAELATARRPRHG